MLNRYRWLLAIVILAGVAACGGGELERFDGAASTATTGTSAQRALSLQ